MFAPFCLAVRRFGKKDDGTATVESVLWLPIFLALFGLMLDASMIFHGQSKVLRIVQDANRNMSIGRFTTAAEVEDYIDTQLALFDVTPTSTTTQATTAAVLTVVEIPAREFQALGYFTALLNLDITVSHGHIQESISETELDAFLGATATY